MFPDDPALFTASPSDPIRWRCSDPIFWLSCLLEEGDGNAECIVSLSKKMTVFTSIVICRSLTYLLGRVKIVCLVTGTLLSE